MSNWEHFLPGATEPLRLVLVGLQGVGKSASGNTILGSKEFRSDISSISVTLQSEIREGLVFERSVMVVDTPALFNTERKHEIENALTLCHPGPHAILVVIQLGRFTEQERRVMEKLSEVLGSNVNLYSMVLFTYGDKLMNKTIDQFVKEDTHLLKLIKQCGGRHHVFNNSDPENKAQVRELLEKIDNQIKKRKKKPYFVTGMKCSAYPLAKILCVALPVVALLALAALAANKRASPSATVENVITNEATGNIIKSVPDISEKVLEKSRTMYEIIADNKRGLITIAVGIGAGLWILRKFIE